MNIKIVETSLNLRIERGKQKEDYTLSSAIAEKQLAIDDNVDIYCNVEFMECNNSEYMETFSDAGYRSFTSLDAKGRGILCEIKEKYSVKEITTMADPHMLHLRVEDGNDYIDLITVRILVVGGGDDDFQDRRRQWERVLGYIDSLPNDAHIVLIGDLNHGVICHNFEGYEGKPRRFFNYQMVVNDLDKRGIVLYPIKGKSFLKYLKIDHIAARGAVIDSAAYTDIFETTGVIGVPDHSCILASLHT